MGTTRQRWELLSKDANYLLKIWLRFMTDFDKNVPNHEKLQMWVQIQPNLDLIS